MLKGLLYWQRALRGVAACVAVLFVVTAWEAIGRSGWIHPSLFPPPSSVARAFAEMVASGEMRRDVTASLWRALVGLAAGCIAGVVVGVATGRARLVDAFVSPLIQTLRPLPPVALIPLILVWFGIGELSKVFSIAFATFFPVWINSHLGVRDVPEKYLWSARVLGYGKIRTLLQVVVPASLPYIIAGIRNGVSIAFVMVFVSELAGASVGIGYQINASHLAYRVDRMMASLFVLGIAGATVDRLLALGADAAFPWLRRPAS